MFSKYPALAWKEKKIKKRFPISILQEQHTKRATPGLEFILMSDCLGPMGSEDRMVTTSHSMDSHPLPKSVDAEDFY